ncbi:MAG: histidine kinase [Ramlibacter sp.]
MKSDWIEKLQHLLQALAFCLAIATIQYGFEPERAYLPRLVGSLCIGISIWAIVDLGRHLFPSARETGWPDGLQGLGLVAGGIVVGYLFGSRLADYLCRVNGWYTGPPVNHEADVRSSILITVMAGLVGSFYFYSINRSAYLERKMGEARKHANEARLKLLETQLEPHMLFNTLANLRVLIGVDPMRAQGMLDHMIAYLRATLDASRATTHSLQAEFDRLQDYLELMQIRLGTRLQYELLLPRELAQHPVPALLLQPLVENSIKHGLEPKVDGGHVLVSAAREGDRLVLQVQDTGLGESASGNGKGFGLTQVRERLATLYGDQADADFEAVPGTGATVTLRLPIQP